MQPAPYTRNCTPLQGNTAVTVHLLLEAKNCLEAGTMGLAQCQPRAAPIREGKCAQGGDHTARGVFSPHQKTVTQASGVTRAHTKFSDRQFSTTITATQQHQNTIASTRSPTRASGAAIQTRQTPRFQFSLTQPPRTPELPH